MLLPGKSYTVVSEAPIWIVVAVSLKLVVKKIKNYTVMSKTIKFMSEDVKTSITYRLSKVRAVIGQDRQKIPDKSHLEVRRILEILM